MAAVVLHAPDSEFPDCVGEGETGSGSGDRSLQWKGMNQAHRRRSFTIAMLASLDAEYHDG